MLPYWPQLLLFMGAVLLAALYALTASGHFPAEFRGESLKGRPSAVLLWATMLATSIAAVAAIVWAWGSLPWYAAVIGGGAVLLFAPLLLQPLPDSFVNGRRSLAIFSAGAAMLAATLWMAFRAS